jgi:hypothetical protein
VEKGILVGSGGNLLPKENATRAQLAAILTRYLKLHPEQLPEPLPDPTPEPEIPAPELPEQNDALAAPPNDGISAPANGTPSVAEDTAILPEIPAEPQPTE